MIKFNNTLFPTNLSLLPTIYRSKITHIWRRWGTPQYFCLSFINEIERQLFIKKNCWSFWSHFRVIFVILAMFCPFTSLANVKIKIWKKYKTPGDITLLHMRTINEDHMMYGSWDTRHHRQRFLSFWAIFCPLTLLTTRKIKTSKKWKKVQRYYHFTLVYHKSHHMMYASRDMECNRQSFLSFWTIFCPFTLLTTPKIKISKIYEKLLKILSFYTCVS